MLKLLATLGIGLVAGVSEAPTVHVNLTPIIVAMLALLGLLASAGYLMNRYQRGKAQAETDLAQAQIPMTHAQYENFISQAVQRVQEISETAIARLEKELAVSNRKIAELEAELERVKASRDRTIAQRISREKELRLEIAQLRDHVIDLERRLEAHGVKARRHGDRLPQGGDESDEQYRRRTEEPE